jgi:hypothetical protein
MITAEELRQAYDEASAAADAKKKPMYIRWMERAWEFLIPAEGDDLPVFCRCRCCGSVSVTGWGKDHVPERHLGVRVQVDSPCGYCRPHALPRQFTLQGIRERYRAGQPLGIGGQH